MFTRRRQQQETHTAELAENLRQHEALCVEVEALAESDADADGLTAQLRELDRRWRDAETLPIPRQSAAGLSRRWQTARSLVEARRHEALDLLAAQAALCERLERTLEAGIATASVATVVAADWQVLPTQRDPGLQTAIEKRLRPRPGGLPARR